MIALWCIHAGYMQIHNVDYNVQSIAMVHVCHTSTDLWSVQQRPTSEA